MTIKFSFDVKAGKSNLGSCTVEADSPAAAAALYRQVLEEFAGDAPKPTRAPKSTQPEQDADAAPEQPQAPEQAQPTPISGKRAEKDERTRLNQKAIQWAERARLLIPDLAKFETLDLLMNFNASKKEIALLSVTELCDLIKAIHSAVTAYSMEHPEVAAYLEIIGIVDASTSMADLEERKKDYKGFKVLSKFDELFHSAKKYHDDKAALLTASEAVADTLVS